MEPRLGLRRSVARVVVATGVFVTGFALNVLRAPSAHAQLLSTVDPPDRAVLTDGPTQLRLRFDRPIRRLDTQLEGPNGSVDLGPVVRESESTFVATVPSLRLGSYQVGWEATSEAGSVRTGSTSFRLVASNTTAPSAAAPTPPPAPSTISSAATGPRVTSPATIPPTATQQRPSALPKDLSPASLTAPRTQPPANPSASPSLSRPAAVTKPGPPTTAATRTASGAPRVAVGVASILPKPSTTPPSAVDAQSSTPSPPKGSQPTTDGSPPDTITLDGFLAPTSPTIGNELAGALHTTPAMDALGGDGLVIGTDPFPTNATPVTPMADPTQRSSPEDPHLRQRRMVTGVAGAAFVLLGLALFIIRRKR